MPRSLPFFRRCGGSTNPLYSANRYEGAGHSAATTTAAQQTQNQQPHRDVNSDSRWLPCKMCQRIVAFEYVSICYHKSPISNLNPLYSANRYEEAGHSAQPAKLFSIFNAPAVKQRLKMKKLHGDGTCECGCAVCSGGTKCNEENFPMHTADKLMEHCLCRFVC